MGIMKGFCGDYKRGMWGLHRHYIGIIKGLYADCIGIMFPHSILSKSK